MILLTGATGRVAGAAAGTLAAAGVPFRAMVRNPDKFKLATSAGIDVFVGDLEVTDDVRRALDDVTHVLLVTANSEKQSGIERGFCEQAVAAGARHIVKISSMEAGPEAKATIPRLHYETEQYIKSLDVAWTMVQPNFFMQNLLMYSHSIKQANVFSLPLGDAKTGIVDARDVGAVCAAVLQEQGHENRTYQVTGSELLSFHEVAARMSKALGRNIAYVDQSPDAFRDFLSQAIPSPWHVDAVCGLFAQIADHALEHLTTTVEDTIRRAPTTVEQFTTDHGKAF